ncbi:hypothetical protein NDU88_001174 [Pleurodeles waltl]|uniref:Uncharacterized protein n=1 Tax=Pleurodeles waltl TaxID=8319 RepID=A0AAV7S959_PLEWA|nr:hypothetical protein NDU88_001174 [Pleurodeles waltl]
MEPKWEESLDLVTRKDFFEEKQLVTLRAQHKMAGYEQHVNLQRFMPQTDVHWHKEDTCEACRAFRSRKTLRDRRARRLQMALTPTGQELFEEEEEAFSIHESDSEELEAEEMPKTVTEPRHRKRACWCRSHPTPVEIPPHSNLGPETSAQRDFGTVTAAPNKFGTEKPPRRKLQRFLRSLKRRLKKFRFRNIQPRNRKQVPIQRDKDCPPKCKNIDLERNFKL